MSLHNHIVPQEYLEHFGTTENSESIWRYDKRSARWEQLPVKSVSQRMDFFSEEDERMLNEKVEGPAIRHLKKLRAGEQLNQGGREAIGEYIARMVARTERMRLKMANSLKQEVAGVEDNPGLWAMQWGLPVVPMLKHLSDISESLQTDPLRTKEPLLHRVLDLPEVRDNLVEMNWQVFTAVSSERFLTSDHPVFVSESKGLKPPHGEFLFPLASGIALVGSWQGPKRGLSFSIASSRFIKEFNRYVVSGSDRWLYYHERAGWLDRVVRNRSTRRGREAW